MGKGNIIARRMDLVQEALYLAADCSLGFEDSNWATLTGPIEDAEALVDKMKLLKAEIRKRLDDGPNSPYYDPAGFVRLPDLKDFGL